MRLCLAAAACLAVAANADAQRLFHDKDRDATAQKAAEAAKQVTSGALFETMLRNVDAQAKAEVEITMLYVQEQMRAKLNAFERWHDVRAHPPRLGPDFPAQAKLCNKSVECVLQALKEKHEAALVQVAPGEIEKRLAEIKAKQEALKAEVKALEEANTSRDPVVLRALAALDDPGHDLVEQAEAIAKLGGEPTAGLVKALDALSSGLDQVAVLYKVLQGIWNGQKAVSVDPASLRPPRQQVELQLLAVEQDYLKVLARIEAREQVEVAAALGIVTSALQSIAGAGLDKSEEPIEASLRSAAADKDRDHLIERLTVLYETAAGVAQMDAAAGLADLRRSDEERRYSIRRSLVNARTYDATIQAAVDRLGLYWKSGIKPGELAQLAFYLANTVAVPAIALKD